MSLPLGQRALFELPDDVTYLNCAYLAPQLRAVREAGEQALRRRAAPWELAPRDFYSDVEHARARFARLIGAEADQIALVHSVSYGMMVATACCPLRRGQNVVVLAEEFPSTIYAWRERARRRRAQLRVAPRPTMGLDHGWTESVLAAIDADTAVVAVTPCHWTDGGRVDLERVGARAREVGAALVVDGTQSIGACPFSVDAVLPDLVAFAAYKWGLCPYGVSFLYVAPRHHRARPPEHPWTSRAGSEDFSRLADYRDDFQPGARRFDGGERANFILLPMAVAALDQLLAWGVPSIHGALTQLTTRLADGARSLGLEVIPADQRAGHMLGIKFPRGLPPDLVHPLVERRIYVSVRGDALRVSPHLHSSPEDIDRLLGCLRAGLA
jgi:selenocysteine lyase/cysteine desulfurase